MGTLVRRTEVLDMRTMDEETEDGKKGLEMETLAETEGKGWNKDWDMRKLDEKDKVGK